MINKNRRKRKKIKPTALTPLVIIKRDVYRPLNQREMVGHVPEDVKKKKQTQGNQIQYAQYKSQKCQT